MIRVALLNKQLITLIGFVMKEVCNISNPITDAIVHISDKTSGSYLSLDDSLSMISKYLFNIKKIFFRSSKYRNIDEFYLNIFSKKIIKNSRIS